MRTSEQKGESRVHALTGEIMAGETSETVRERGEIYGEKGGKYFF